MAKSPILSSSDPIELSVFIEDKLISNSLEIASVNIDKFKMRPSVAVISFVSNTVLAGFDYQIFSVGNYLRVDIGYGTDVKTIITGIINKLNINASLNGMYLNVTCMADPEIIVDTGKPQLALNLGENIIKSDFGYNNTLTTLTGTVQFPGSNLAEVGTSVQLNGFGWLSGSSTVFSVKHIIIDGIWTTTIGFGAPDNLSASINNIQDGVIYPALKGLRVGVVKEIAAPLNNGRIKVVIPDMGNDYGVWATLANLYTGAGYGSLFIPDIGDEVYVGFVNEDPEQPVVLGSVYSNSHTPPFIADNNNYIKCLVTKSKLSIVLDDEKKAIAASTPGGNKICISDDTKGISLSDENGNSIIMSPDGITINSSKDIRINAEGAVNLQSIGKLNLETKQDVTVTGLNISVDAAAGVEIKGTATAELSAGGQTTIKGAMIMIN